MPIVRACCRALAVCLLLAAGRAAAGAAPAAAPPPPEDRGVPPDLDLAALVDEYLAEVEALVASGLCHVLAHFDYVFKQVPDLAETWRTARYWERVDGILARCIAGGVALEVNSHHIEDRGLGLAADAEVSDLLTHEITLTEEVREIAHLWRSRGALLFGLSDKPDEASLPDEALQKQGYQPIHRTPTHAVGERIFPLPS